MRSVYESPILADATIVRDMLAENGVEARVVEGHSPYPSTGTIAAEVWVARGDRDRALELVRRLESSKRQDEQKDWTCRECRESNPGGFEVCWNCGTARTW